MSRFADPTKVERWVIGSCECPGKPHPEDWMELRTELGAGAVNRIAGGDSIDMLEAMLVRWNLLNEDGTDALPDRKHVELLWGDIFDAFNKWSKEHLRIQTLPNGSAVRSRTISRANGSSTPKVLTAP